MYWKDEFDKYDLIDDEGQGGMVHPMSGLGQVLRQGGMDMMNMFKGIGDEMDPGIYANPPKRQIEIGPTPYPPATAMGDILGTIMEGGQAMGEMFKGTQYESQYPEYEFENPDGTGYSFDPNNPMNLYPDDPDSPYYDPGPMDFDEDDPYWDSFA